MKSELNEKWERQATYNAADDAFDEATYVAEVVNARQETKRQREDDGKDVDRQMERSPLDPKCKC